MGKYSELEIMAQSRRILDEDLTYFLTIEPEDKWLGSEATLNELKVRRKNKELGHSFTAIIDDRFYVADKNIISIWQENVSGELQYTDVIYWYEVDEQHFSDLPIFILHTGITHDIETFHDKIVIIFAMYNAARDLFTPFDYCFESRQDWQLDCEDLLKQRDFDGLISKLRDIVEPILFNAAPSYMNVQRLAEKEMVRKRLLEQQLIAQNMPTTTVSELANLCNDDNDLDFFMNLK